MRLATICLVIVIALLQWPLWLGKGSWLTVWQLQEQLTHQHAANQKLIARNQSLSAEVLNLKTGFDAVEERARSELGMIKPDEIFFQVLKPGSIPQADPVAPLAASQNRALPISPVFTESSATPASIVSR